MRENIGNLVLRAIALLATLGLLMLSFGFHQHYWGPPEQDFGNLTANALATRAELSAADAMFLAFPLYGLLLGEAIYLLSRFRLWFASVWIESLTGLCLLYIILYTALVFTAWQSIQAFPDSARLLIQRVFTPVDRIGYFLVAPAHALQ